MNRFYIRKILEDNIPKLIKEVGFDMHYINGVSDKYRYTLLKIHNLSSPQCNIIKQLALSAGTDAAVHRDVITCKIENSSILLGGSARQLGEIAEKLKKQPFKLSEIADLINNELTRKLSPLKIRNTVFDWNSKTYIMGILNVTPDSFSDGGQFFSTKKAVEHAKHLINSGADIIDIGGESTRPFSKEVNPDEELKRIIPVIKAIREFDTNIPLSIDTRHSNVAIEAMHSGADIINDVSGFDHDENMINVAFEHQCPVIIMHSLSNPETMQINPVYQENVVDAVYKKLCDKIALAMEKGVKKENIIIDPGIGFGKTLEHNYELIKRISELKSAGCALMAGISRKSVISKIIETAPEDREEANIALNSFLASNGVNILRVHDTAKHVKAFKVLDKVIKKQF
jgi:dihydropteroate synthase